MRAIIGTVCVIAVPQQIQHFPNISTYFFEKKFHDLGIILTHERFWRFFQTISIFENRIFLQKMLRFSCHITFTRARFSMNYRTFRSMQYESPSQEVETVAIKVSIANVAFECRGGFFGSTGTSLELRIVTLTYLQEFRSICDRHP